MRLSVRIMILISLLPRVLHAGLEDLPIGARAIGMGGTYVAVANTAESVFLNPGGLGQIAASELALFYQKPFGLSELNFGMAALTLRAKKHNLGLGVLTFGDGIYHENVLALCYGRDYPGKLYWGIGLRFQTVGIRDYGSAYTFGLDFGFVVPLVTGIKFGFVAKNLNRPSIGDANEPLPQTYKAGISVDPAPKVLINLEIFKDLRFAKEIRFGTELQALDNLVLRAGVADSPNRFSAGFGIVVRRVSLDYAFLTHNDLGLTHQMSLTFRLGKKHPKVETKPAIAEEIKTSTNADAPDETEVSAGNLIDINSASAEELEALPGIGKHLAQEIVEYRRKHGRFSDIDQLLKVLGIGPRKLDQIRSLIFIR